MGGVLSLHLLEFHIPIVPHQSIVYNMLTITIIKYQCPFPRIRQRERLPTKYLF